MGKGLFITVEGGDGAGKTTQLEFIRRFFKEQGADVIFTREPGGTPIGEKIRGIILDRENREMGDMTETLLYAASRAQLIHQVIGPALERGKIVVCDRYVDSSIAYQGYGRGLGDSVAAINSYAIGGVMPDLTLLLLVDPDRGQDRINRGKDRLEEAGDAFHRRVYEGYLALMERFPERIVGIDGSRSIEEVSEDIASALTRLLMTRD